MQLRVQGFIRPLDNTLVLEGAMGRNDPRAQPLVDDTRKWIALRDHIFELMPRGMNALDSIVNAPTRAAYGGRPGGRAPDGVFP